MRKTVFRIALALLLTSLILSLAFNVQPVKSDYTWTQTIYIRANGSVEPSDAPISTVDNVIYTLTNNIIGNVSSENSAIVVERDNIMIDGAGYTIQGIGAWSSKGIYLPNRSNVTIKNISVKTFYYGVYLGDSSNNIIHRSRIENNSLGIYSYFSSYNIISENNIINNKGEYISPFVWSGYGIFFYGGFNNTVSRNNIINNRSGIDLYKSSNNTISGNYIASHWRGVYLGDYSNFNIVFRNNIKNNYCGIWLEYSSNNTFYHNNFINNEGHISIFWDVYGDVWDNGYPFGGNYWSDYAGVDEKIGPNQDQLGSDGIGDTPYVIDAGNQDKYPLMDTVPSAVAISLSGVLGDNGWFTSDVAVVLFAMNNEVNEMEYTFNNITWTTYTTPFTVTNEGTTTVYYRSIDGAGNIRTTKTKTIKIDKTVPSANAGNNETIKVGETVTFDASVSTDNFGIINYEWDFGDGTTGIGITVNHTYTSPGTYNVTLTVKDVAGNIATDTIEVTVLSTEAFPIWIFAVDITVIAIAILVLLKLRKRKSSNAELYGQP
ncbi:MAG: NosD domain-containing protein [Candidatus Bathyarchaeia archaeon]